MLIVGAGASGRGHVGQLAFESGWRLAFVDTDRALVDGLRAAGRYEVRLVGDGERTVTVDGFTVFRPDDEGLQRAFDAAAVVCTAVRPENLAAAADELRPLFARWLERTGGRSPKNVLCCENMNRGTTEFRHHLGQGFPPRLLPALEAAVGFPDTMIARVVATPVDPLRLLGEEYSEWTAQRSAFRGTPPEVRTLQPVESQERYLQRKLYIHNTGHAVLAYLGFLKGYRYVHEAGLDPEVMAACELAIEESGWGIEREHGFPPDVIAEYRAALTKKCVLPQLPDSLERVVRDPLRKLGPDERFFGPIDLVTRHGREPRHLLFGAAAALAARIPGDAQSARIAAALAAGGVGAVLSLAGVEARPGLVAGLEAALAEVRARFAPPAGGAR